MEIQRISIPRNVIRDIPPPALRDAPPPVVSTLELPVIDVPNPVIEYPTLDVPTQQEFESQFVQPTKEEVVDEPDNTRELPPPVGPTINVAGVNVTLPPLDTVATTGATAVIATTASLTAALLVKKATDVITEVVKKKKFKVKVKKIKPVLHFVKTDSGKIDIFEYSKKGTRLVGSTDKIETYLRDQINNNAYYEVTNKIIVDDNLMDEFTTEGKTRFKSLFVPPAKMAKKLSAKFSI